MLIAHRLADLPAEDGLELGEAQGVLNGHGKFVGSHVTHATPMRSVVKDSAQHSFGERRRNCVADLLVMFRSCYPGRMTTCSAESCNRDVRAKGMCLMHYKRDRYGWVGRDEVRPAKPVCEFCERPVLARGWCNRHYRQWQHHGDPQQSDRNRPGSTRVAEDGYLVLRGSSGTPVHRAIMNAQPGQVVHHVNGVKLDNQMDNLDLLDSQSQHKLAHASLESAAFELVRSGVIQYDFSTHTYFLRNDRS